jgi:hypothetical protein
MPSEDYKALTLRLYAAIGEVFRTGDTGLLDPFLAPDMVDHTPASGPIIGREPGKQLIASFARFSGYHQGHVKVTTGPAPMRSSALCTEAA